FGTVVLVAAAADPVVLAAARVVALDHVAGVAVAAEPGDLIALGRAVRGDVDVEQHPRGEPVHKRGPGDRGGEARGMLELEDAAAHQAERDGRNAENHAFHGGGDGARIDDVVGEVGPVVDAGEHERGRLVFHQVVHREVDTVGRRAV